MDILILIPITITTATETVLRYMLHYGTSETPYEEGKLLWVSRWTGSWEDL